MTVNIRQPAPNELEELVTLDFRNFGATVEDGDVDEVRGELPLERFLVAEDNGRLVAAAGSYGMELTLPGPTTLPVSGVTWVSVAASHTRRGLAARLMAGLDDMAAGFGEPLLALTASEGGIYERFGYGNATTTRVTEIDRRRTTLDPRWQPDPVELVAAQDHVAELMERYERYRLAQVGEVSRPTEEQFRVFTMNRNKPPFAALHPDGYALYTIEPKWNDGHPAHDLRVSDLIAATPEAHLALWNLLLSIDLVGTIRGYRAMALDDPLPYLLTDPRAARTTDLNDGLWVKVADPMAAFAARSYRVDDRLVLAVVESVDDLVGGAEPAATVAISASGGTGDCATTDEEPDLRLTRAALGPLLLGCSASQAALGRRIAGSAAALGRADAFFGWSPSAHCRTGF